MWAGSLTGELLRRRYEKPVSLRPSGDHELALNSASELPGTDNTLMLSPPAASLISAMKVPPPPRAVYASRVPSGDHIGPLAPGPPVDVSCLSWLPSAFMIQISKFPLLSDSKAI